MAPRGLLHRLQVTFARGGERGAADAGRALGAAGMLRLLLLLLESGLGCVQSELTLEKSPRGDQSSVSIAWRSSSTGLGGLQPLSLIVQQDGDAHTRGAGAASPLRGGDAALSTVCPARNKSNKSTPSSVTGDSLSWLFAVPQDLGLHRANLVQECY